ncbi:polysialyltransferase family glycosyltransferase [Streptomyces sp. NPDC046831]|uniref:polysialyltransferase family glycosyltransferase n=1 Tax=Streptomyces sp. NPDC046831 TaxID=3154805 RepID=UPI0033CB9BAA
MPRTTLILCASSLRGAAVLAAALDAGLLEPADRRLLLVANDAANPETAPAVDAMPGFGRLRERFDEVLSFNDAVAPFHPRDWAPRADDVPLWERHLRLLWRLGDDEVRLTVESVEAGAGLALCRLFPGTAVDVHCDGLAVYGPTSDRIDPLVGTRVGRLLHLDLVPGLAPLLLAEFGVRPEPVPAASYRDVVGELAGAEDTLPGAGDRPALLLGRCLTAPGVLTGAEEEELHLSMVRGAAALGHRRLVFQAHPAAPALRSRLLAEEAARLGAELVVLDRPVLAEAAAGRLRPALVAGCSPTALLAAAGLHGVPAARVGTGTLLGRLTPYQHADRVPVTILDALLPGLAGDAAVEAWTPPPAERVAELSGLLAAVGYAMRPRVRPDLRDAAESYLSTRLSPHTWRYFTRGRLAALALPGAVPAPLASLPRNATVRRLARHARDLSRRRARP